MSTMTYGLGQKPKLLSPWRLRKEKSNIVVYKCSTEDNKHKALSPAEAVIIAFFDGNNTIEEIYDYWRYIRQANGDNSRILDESLGNIIDGWVGDGIIGTTGEPSPSLKKNPECFIPDFKCYVHPVYRLERPLNVNVAFTNKCRTNCRYCYAERHQCGETDLPALNSLFDELAENEIYIVDISGGDPLTHTSIIPVLQSMVVKDFVFFLSTKCYISERTAVSFHELGIGTKNALPHLIRPLQISVDSANPEIAAFLSGRKNYLDRAVSSVRNAIKSGLSPRIKSVLTPYNADDAEDIIKFFSDLGVTNFQFVQYGRSYFRHDDSLFLNPDHKSRLVETSAKLRHDYPDITFSIQEETSAGPPRKMGIERWHTRALCSGGRVSMKVQPNGDVTLCDQMPHRSEFVVGNIFEQGLLPVWNSPKLIGFLNAGRECFTGTACYECNEFEWCHYKVGYCFRDSFFHFGTVYDAPPDCPYQTKEGIRAI